MTSTTQTPPEALVRQIRQANRVLVTAHKSPDGDAIGSELGLARILRQMGKSAVVWNHDVTPAIYEELRMVLAAAIKGTQLMRKYACCYAQGRHGARHFRRYVAKVSTRGQFLRIVEEYFPVDKADAADQATATRDEKAEVV